MHYYQFNIGDYQSHTKHLTPIEDICYRRLLDHYYLHEKPIENNVSKVSRFLLLSGYEKEVEQMLIDFFELTDEGWINHRADVEIQQYQYLKESGKRGAAIRWGKGGDSPPNSPPNGEGNATPIANNKHKPINNKQRATPISEDFGISDRVQKWADEKGFKNLDVHLENFVGSCKANGYKYIDWDQAFMNAVRNNWAKVKDDVKVEKLEWK